MVRHLDLFSGVAGFALALKPVVSTVMFCEIDADAVDVLRRHIASHVFPKAQVVGDVRRLNPVPCDVVTAGWPCVGFSRCGNRKGFENEQSALFSEVIRVVKLSRPKVVVLENVPEVAREEAYIAAQFKKLGYKFESGVYTAEQVGLPQVRARWFGLAHRDGPGLLRRLAELPLPPIGTQPSVKVRHQKGQTARFKLLRNAVVPRTAALATRCLATRALGGACCTGARPPMDLKLCITQGSVSIRKRIWPTLHGGWRRGGPILTDRGSRDIQTAVRHARHLPKEGETSLRWLEWLMGYPRDWTLAA